MARFYLVILADSCEFKIFRTKISEKNCLTRYLHFTESSELGAGKWRMGHIRNPEVFDGQDGLEDHDGE